MIECKICGISDAVTLKKIINHQNPPKFIGFICNYTNSKRYVELEKLKKLINVDKNGINFVAVLVNPSESFLEKIKNLNFDYYQLYDVPVKLAKKIKDKYNKKIISSITVQNENDVKKYLLYEKISDIILFDSKGYEKSFSFDHKLIKNLKLNKKIMIAGNIKFNEQLDKFNKIADIIDISGGLETLGKKDISKINIFLNNLNIFNYEN